MNWSQFTRAVGSRSKRWVYRGSLDRSKLETGLERCCRAWGIPLSEAPAVEERMVREFRRHPEALGHIADKADYLEVLALMQHHGAPTRLLDWTYSPYVAAFFALERLLAEDPSRERRATIWALDVEWLTARVRAVLSNSDWRLYTQKKDGSSFKKLFVDRTPRLQFIGTATPMILNQRLSVQQGLFLCPGDVTKSWKENLNRLASNRKLPPLRAFHLDRSTMKTAVAELAAMNVTARSLFPGLDGYSRHIVLRAYHLWKTPVLGE